MYKLLVLLFALTSLSSYADCTVALPYNHTSTKYIVYGGEYVMFTPLDVFARKRGINLVSVEKADRADAVITQSFSKRYAKSLFCGEKTITNQYVQTLGAEFKGYRSVSFARCESQHLGATYLKGIRKAIKHISEKLNCLQ